MMSNGEKVCFYLIAHIVLGTVGVLLVYSSSSSGVTSAVEVTVDEASLDCLALVAPGNGTASVSYNLAMRNPNWPTRVWAVAPLNDKLRLAAQPFALVWLASSDSESEEHDRIRPWRSKVYRVAAAAAAARSAPRKSAAGIFGFELIVSGDFKSEGRHGSSITTMRMRCSRRRLLLSTALAALTWARFERTLPLPGIDISDDN